MQVKRNCEVQLALAARLPQSSFDLNQTDTTIMLLEAVLEVYPKDVVLKSGQTCPVRPLESGDEPALLDFFRAVPTQEVMFMKHRVTDTAVIHDWCQSIDLGRNLPLLGVAQDKILGVGTLHQQLGGWKRHIGRVSVLVHPGFRGRGLAKALVSEIILIAREVGLEKVEAEFICEQKDAIKVFGLLGFTNLVCLPDYVRDMQAVAHDYVLMGLDLKTDEEYAGMG